MDKEELSNVSFEIVAYSGEARSKLLNAVKAAKAHSWDEYETLVAEAREAISDAHKSQFALLTAEAQGNDIDLNIISVHAQDHLMTTLLLLDVIDTLADVYR